MIRTELADNPLRSHDDLLRACRDLLTPIQPYFDESGSGFMLGDTGVHYKQRTARFEGFARFLLGAAPLLKAGGSGVDVTLLQQGLETGTHPDHPGYWGDPASDYQLLIDMSGISQALLLIPDLLYDTQPDAAKQHIKAWLGSANTRRFSKNNQQLFRALTCAALRQIGADEFDEDVLLDCFANVNQMHVGGGCYTDGIGSGPVDYYASWVFHWGALIVNAFIGDTYPHLREIAMQRATDFAVRFKHWFARSGEALPYGRSLTYRSGQNAFWAACAFADVPALPWGQMKGLYLRNMRWWLRQPMFTDGGLPSIGYAYPNLKICEQYNSPNSPLWTFTSFIALAVSPDHPFWQAEEEPLEKSPTFFMKEAGMILHDDQISGHLLALNNSQRFGGYPCHQLEQKYDKNAYSSYFAFCVQTGNTGLPQQAADNTLLLSEDGEYFHHKRMSECVAVTQHFLSSRWKPFPGVMVQSWIIPMFPWHLCVYEIQSDRSLLAVEGGWALPRTDTLYDEMKNWMGCAPGRAAVWAETGFSGLAAYDARTDTEIVPVAPHANLQHPNVVIPVLKGWLPAGHHFLYSACIGHPDPAAGKSLWEQCPDTATIMAHLSKYSLSALSGHI